MDVIKKEHFTRRSAPHTYITDATLRNEIDDRGYVVMNVLTTEELQLLRELNDEKHNLTETGMFYSLYSKDLVYRKEIYDRINVILHSFLEKNFKDFQVLYNIFILKAPGRESEFFVHQEPSMMDETKFSPLHIWIPLEDINEKNGAVCLAEKTHKLYAPDRGISFSSVFENIQATVQRYMQPIYMKAGEVLIFDPRMIHYSLPNFSDHTRAAVLCGLAPQEADVVIAHREPGDGQKVELIKQDIDFFLKADDLYLNCKCRPETGRFEKYSGYEPYLLTDADFDDFCQYNDIKPKDILPPFEQVECIMYGEPRQELNLYNSRTFKPEMM